MLAGWLIVCAAAMDQPWTATVTALADADAATAAAALADTVPPVRRAAGERLTRLGGPGRAALDAALEHPRSRAGAAQALVTAGLGLAPGQRARLVRDEDPAVRRWAPGALAAAADHAGLAGLAIDPVPGVADAALRAACAVWRGPGSPPAVRAAVATLREDLVWLALDGMDDHGLAAADLGPALAAAVDPSRADARSATALEALMRIDPAAATTLALRLADRRGLADDLRAAVADVLAWSEDPGIGAVVGDALAGWVGATDTWWGARAAAACALLRHGDPRGLADAGDALGDGTGVLADALRPMLEAATGVACPDAAAVRAWRARPGAVPRPLDLAYGGADVRLFDCSGLSRRIVYLLDVSGSMRDLGPGGSLAKRDGAAAEVRRSIARLPLDARFTVVVFADRAATWTPATLRASWRVRAACLDRLTATPSLGGTNTWSALASALEMPRVTAAFLLSDGEPSTGARTAPDAILAGVAGLNAVREPPLVVHGVAYHAAASPGAVSLLRDLAALTAGTVSHAD
jgi:hypothetical protein